MDIENSPFTEAVVKLAERRELKWMSLSAEVCHGQATNEYKHMMEAHTLAANFYSHLLLNTVEGEKALQYLEKRGFTREYRKIWYRMVA